MKRSQRQCQSHIFLYFLLSLPVSLLALLSSLSPFVSAKDLRGFHLFVRTLSPALLFLSFHLGKSSSAASTLVWRTISHVWPCSTDPWSFHITPALTTDAMPTTPPSPPWPAVWSLSHLFLLSWWSFSLLPFRKLLALIHILSSPQFPHIY